MRTCIHATSGSSPGYLIFNRDIVLNIPLIANRHAITQKREHLINENLMQKNCKQKCYDYVPNQKDTKKETQNSQIGPEN
jgi:hypothetical protein